MNVWYTLTDSDAFRRFAKRGPGRVVFRSSGFRRAMVKRNRFLARNAEREAPGRFDGVRTFCVFIGHNKSGSSMVGGLLDAHPEMLFSDEVDALRYVEAGFSPAECFHVLLRGSRSEARKGRVTARRLEPYSYAVPGQWQGRIRRPLVMGDTTTGTTTRRLAADPELLGRVQEAMDGIEFKLVQMIRNPFDPIAAMMVRGSRSFRDACDHYFRACENLLELRSRAGDRLRPVRYETFVAGPRGELSAVCAFLGVDPPGEYLSACAGIIRSSPDRTRRIVRWEPPWIREVERRIAQVPFLSGYGYEP